MRKAIPRPAVAVVLGLLFTLLPVSATAAPTPATGDGPVVTTPDKKPDDDRGVLRIPGLEAESEHLYLAMVDAALELADAEAIVAAVEEADIAPGTRILLGVDREPSTFKSPKQLVRGMLLFGGSGALADDWTEKGKSHGYVGKDWIAIGVILPATAGGTVGVAIDPGRNMRLEAPGGLDGITAAGTAAFDERDYTRGISELAVAAGTGLRPSLDAVPWLLRGGAVLLLVLITTWVFRSRTRKYTAKRDTRRKRALVLARQMADAEPRILRLARSLRPFPDSGVLARRGTQLLDGLEPRVREATAQADLMSVDARRAAERDTLQVLERSAGEYANLEEALESLVEVSGGRTQGTRLRQRQIAAQRAALQDVALGLDVEGARSLPPARELLVLSISQSNALDELTASGREPEDWDRLEALRLDFTAVVRDFVAAAQTAGIRLPDGLKDRARTPGFGEGDRLPEDDNLLERFELAAGNGPASAVPGAGSRTGGGA